MGFFGFGFEYMVNGDGTVLLKSNHVEFGELKEGGIGLVKALSALVQDVHFTRVDVPE